MYPLLKEQMWMVNPITFLLQFFANYGWYCLGSVIVVIYLIQKLMPQYRSWQQAREDAEYHKDPDKLLSRMEAIERARQKQQRELEAASLRAKEIEKEREERKRQENLERLQKYGTGPSGSGKRLGSSDEDYLPLSGGASTSSYRPPKRSACARGGCGR